MTGQKCLDQNDKPAGSLNSGGPVFLVVGKLRRPHGVKGEMLMDVLTDFPERLRSGLLVYVGEEHQSLRIISLRQSNQALLVAFEPYRDPESVGVLRNQFIYVRADDRPPLPEGEFYHHQLIGLRVITDEGVVLGQLSSILETGANDVYVVTLESGREALLPAISSVILDIDLEQGEMQVHLLPGLMPD